MKMNLPNKLTVLRIILIPFFVFFMLENSISPWFKWISVAIFCIASLTDMLDGKIARKYNLVTNFGKFMDPLADKLLVSSALICLLANGRIPAWMVIIIIAREFIITGFRLIAAEKGSVIAANYWGKIKTAFSIFAIILLICDLGGELINTIETVSLWIMTLLTIISLVTYLIQNREIMK